MTLSDFAVWVAERLLAPGVVALGVFVFTRRHYLKEGKRQREEAQKAMLKLLACELGRNHTVLQSFQSNPTLLMIPGPFSLDVFRAFLREIGRLPGDLPHKLYDAYTAIVTARNCASGARSHMHGRQALLKPMQVVSHGTDKIVLNALHALPDGEAALEELAKTAAVIKAAQAAQAELNRTEATLHQREADDDTEEDI